MEDLLQLNFQRASGDDKLMKIVVLFFYSKSSIIMLNEIKGGYLWE